ncbi:poly-gamma-glutamate synthesis protein (capsule biosynthesis protein) [Microbispora rosea]|uniref:Poly-gamma-glutamate synthesis protein (Capsule biosynthesis protein) n=1 Tax=Microbispora rosea TaxID=58117 RepID=A0A1N7G6E0_9ACTN|nr:capsular polysaccharide biosynthesis protein [Microbispora rosea subsp. rosea]SIS08131.1 poly-gamma-glutamate synthesis protein (capsule biosynthesis protein) [Microbispora rosea]
MACSGAVRRQPLALSLFALLAAPLLVAGCSPAESEPVPGASQPEVKTATPAPKPQRRPFTISFAGDVHFEGILRNRLDADPRTALGPIAAVLRRSNLTALNLETAITTAGTPAPGKQFTFRAPAAAFTALKAAGVDVVTMANNHGMDYMESGLRDTLAAIRSSKFPVIGIGANETEAYRPYRRTVNGNRVSIIGATQVLDQQFIQSWTASGDKAGLASAKNEPRLLRAVRQARKNSDTVIVFLHWGTELVKCPTPVQRSLADKLVAAGADVIVGSHAHILLGGGYSGEAYVHYGLGNFAFYNWGPDTGTTGVLTLTINGRKVLKDQWTPARINGGVPIPVTGGAKQQALGAYRALRGCTGLSAAPADS